MTNDPAGPHPPHGSTPKPHPGRTLVHRVGTQKSSKIGRSPPPENLFSATDDNAPGGVATDAKGIGDRAERLGDYDLIGRLGEGAMGTVYRALHRSANRIVALKVIRPDRLAGIPAEQRAQTIHRFETEAQATAQLEHANIVTVYDVGEVDGKQYYSMRYVEGQSLAELLQDGPLENRRAATYLEPVARAVHEAHCHGILHRDLKPQNILVDARTDLALVADFGLAKLTEQTEELTRAGEVMGTPSYMSPEQARNSASVTVHSDVYALGATLYHLLTGRPVFLAATPLHTLSQVIDKVPVHPRQLNPAIDRDLDTICLKCLEKEPSRRYTSAEALADELQRYLERRPIEARPLGPLRRLGRWCRRSPLAASFAGLAALGLLLALTATTIGLVTTSVSQRRSEESFRQALNMVNFFYTRVSEETLLNEPGLQPLRQDLLIKARDYYQKFLKQRSNDPTIADKLGETYFHVGLITADVDSPEKALESYDRALLIQRKLHLRNPENAEYLAALTNTLNAKGKALFDLERLNEALQLFEDTESLRAQLVSLEPDRQEYVRKLANTYMNAGIVLARLDQTERARDQIEKAQALREELRQDHSDVPKVLRDLAKGYWHLGDLCELSGDRIKSLGDFQKAATIFVRLLQLEDSINDRYLLNLCYLGLARAQPDTKTTEAVDYYRQAAEGLDALTKQNQSVDKFPAVLGLKQARSQQIFGRSSGGGPPCDASADSDSCLRWRL